MPPKFSFGRTVFIHGFGYFVPAALMIACWLPFRVDEAEQRKMLEEKYSVQINATKASNQNLQDFFDNVKTGDEKTNETLDVVMNSGKTKMTKMGKHHENKKSGATQAADSSAAITATKLGSSRIEAR